MLGRPNSRLTPPSALLSHTPYVQASRIVPAHLIATIFPSFAKIEIVASSTTVLWTGSDNLQDGALRVQPEC